jgi:hypothetical protein
MPHSRLPPLRFRAGSRGGPGVATRRCPGARPEGRQNWCRLPFKVGFDSAAAAAGHRLRAAHARSQSRMVGDVKGTRSRRRWSRGFRRPRAVDHLFDPVGGDPEGRVVGARDVAVRSGRGACAADRSSTATTRAELRRCAPDFARRRMASRTRPGEEDAPRSVWRAHLGGRGSP